MLEQHLFAVTDVAELPGRVVGKAKLSQDKPVDDVRGVVAALEHDAVHANPDLAAAMRTCLASRPANSKG
jgi:predicted FMN-binding regulatory protein PaiB